MQNRLIFILIIVFMSGCTYNFWGEFACTDEFVILTISVEDNQGQPVVYDSVSVNRKSDNFLYQFDVEPAYEPGTYILMTDKYHEDLSRDGTTLLFTGFYDRNSLALMRSYEYVVKRGLCHVEKTDGPDTITFQ